MTIIRELLSCHWEGLVVINCTDKTNKLDIVYIIYLSSCCFLRSIINFSIFCPKRKCIYNYLTLHFTECINSYWLISLHLVSSRAANYKPFRDPEELSRLFRSFIIDTQNIDFGIPHNRQTALKCHLNDNDKSVQLQPIYNDGCPFFHLQLLPRKSYVDPLLGWLLQH